MSDRHENDRFPDTEVGQDRVRQGATCEPQGGDLFVTPPLEAWPAFVTQVSAPRGDGDRAAAGEATEGAEHADLATAHDAEPADIVPAAEVDAPGMVAAAEADAAEHAALADMVTAVEVEPADMVTPEVGTESAASAEVEPESDTPTEAEEPMR